MLVCSSGTCRSLLATSALLFSVIRSLDHLVPNDLITALQRLADAEHDEAVVTVPSEVLQAHGRCDVLQLLLLPPAVRGRPQQPCLDL